MKSEFIALQLLSESFEDKMCIRDRSEGLDGSVKDLDLVGKTKRVLSAKSDAIGFVHRDEESNLCINFGMNGERCV